MIGQQGLPPRDRRKLALILELLSSDKAGERDAAGLAADRFVKARDLTWHAVIDPPAQIQNVYEPAPSPYPPRSQRPRPRSRPVDDEDEPAQWRSLTTAALKHPQRLSKWEADFLAGLPRFPRLSSKQAAVLYGIVAKLRAAGCRI